MLLRSEPEPVEIQEEGTPIAPETLIGTSNGLLYYNGSEMLRLTTEEFVYGITRRNEGEWWLAQRKGNFINRIKFDSKMYPIEFELVVDLRMAGVAEHMGFHQIDFFGDELIICDTYNNRLLSGMYTTKHLIITKVFYPVGWHNLTDSRDRNTKYKHFNSVYKKGKFIYVLAHNETQKTNERSQLFVYDECWNLKSLVSDVGSCAHNIAIDFKQMMYVCDSRDNSLLVYDGDKMEPIFVDERFKVFTRGLAINDDVIVVGGSKRSKDSKVSNRQQDGYLFVLDANSYEVLGVIKIPAAGQIFEVRFVGLDYGLSNTWRNTWNQNK